MKIDFLISKMSDGGAQRVVSLLANYMAENGYKVRIITFRDGDHYPLHKNIDRVRLHKKPLINSVVFSGFFSLLSFYRKKSNRPDIMSSHIDLLGYLTIPVAKLLGLKIIVSEHSNHLSQFTYRERILWKYFYPWADAVTVLTTFDMPFFSKRNPRTFVMPNPYSFSLASSNHNIKNRKKEIMAIGNLNRVHVKGFDNLMLIVEKVSKLHPDWKFVIVGAGSGERAVLDKLINDLNIKDYVTFLGFRSDIKELLAKTGIYILSSRYEGLPMTLLEAMSQGTPSIAYDCVSGPSDIIKNEENGLLIEDQNIDKMVAGLSFLIQNPEVRQKFSTNAPKSLTNFSMDKIGEKWEELYKHLDN